MEGISLGLFGHLGSLLFWQEQELCRVAGIEFLVELRLRPESHVQQASRGGQPEFYALDQACWRLACFGGRSHGSAGQFCGQAGHEGGAVADHGSRTGSGKAVFESLRIVNQPREWLGWVGLDRLVPQQSTVQAKADD